MATTGASRDFYKVLRVSQTASVHEIKQSYRRLVMEFHPDRHGEEEPLQERERKTQHFKLINEAYTILMDVNKRRHYDFEHQKASSHRASKHAHFDRKVYTARPPPDWKFVWDHKYHYEMHYGSGMYKEAIKQARETNEKAGAFEYQSPLGKGFSFDTERPDMNINPFSKKPQGPPKVTLEYEEAYIDMGSGRKHVNRRDRVVENLYSRRVQRQSRNTDKMRRQHESEHARMMQQRYSSQAHNPECVIL